MSSRTLPARRSTAPATERAGEPDRPLRIGVMLRSLDEKGGIGVYTRGILDELLELDRHNHYVLFFRSDRHLGSYADRPNVTERLVGAPHKLVWDQVAVPRACRRERIDVLFHPKFTVPVLAPCPSVMVVHGADWFIPEQARFYGRLDVAQIRLLMPLYIRRASLVLSVTELTTQNFRSVLGLPDGKIRTVYLAPARSFRRVTDAAELERVRRRYDLPDRFILTLTKLSGAERKNFPGVVGAYRRLHGRVPHKLVVGGVGCSALRGPYGIPSDGWGADVVFPDWMDQADLPAVYSMADLYLYPSRLESASIPLMEAMACGTPMVTSDANDLREIAGDAALLVDPEDHEAIADAAFRVLTDASLAADLSERALERSRSFSWDRCARETLAAIVQAGTAGRGRGAGEG
jgi:glycosyltransferase involved in cell wall biosynthesis